jgi:hypothetical protein
MGKLIGKIYNNSLIIFTTCIFFVQFNFLACFIIFNTLWHYGNIIHLTCLMTIEYMQTLQICCVIYAWDMVQCYIHFNILISLAIIYIYKLGKWEKAIDHYRC